MTIGCRGLSGCLLSLLGCAAPLPKGSPAATGTVATQQLYMQARQQTAGTNEWQPLSAEDSLHSGDRYQLLAFNEAPAYLYVARVSSERPLEMLLPRAGAQPERSGAKATLVLPGREEGYVLDAKAGEETIYMAASAGVLSAEAVREVLLSTPPAEPGALRERPPELTEKNRGETAAYVAKPMKPGIVGLRFTFQHLK